MALGTHFMLLEAGHSSGVSEGREEPFVSCTLSSARYRLSRTLSSIHPREEDELDTRLLL